MSQIIDRATQFKPRYRRRALSALLGGVLLVSPLLVGSAPTTDMSLLVAMSTITDVRDSLEEKLTILSQACARAAVMGDGSSEYKQVQKSMEAHYRNAEDIQALAFSFLGTSSQRYPEYAKYWNAYRQRLLGSWQDIRRLHGLLGEGPARLAQELSKPAGGAVEPAEATAPADELVPPPPATAKPLPAEQAAKPPTPIQKDLMARYRDAYRKYSEATPESMQSAREQFEALLGQEPAFHLARYWLARILMQQGHLVEARRHTVTLVADQPGLKIARNLLKDIDSAMGKKTQKPDKGPANAVLHRRARLMPYLGTPAPAVIATAK